MKILLIGNFAPPYEEESLNNISLLKRLSKDGHECHVINISENPSREEGIIDAKGYIGFVFKVMCYGWKKDVIHFSTKGYLRLGLLKLMTSILMGRLFGARTVITIHSELFSIMGQMRSPVGGRQTLFTSFSLAHKIICADKDTYDVAATYKKRHNFILVPSFISVPDEVKGAKALALDRLKDKKKIIVFSNLRYPSFLFKILDSLLNLPLSPDIGIIISVSETPSAKLQHVIEEGAGAMSKNIVFIEADNIPMLIKAYSRADLILRPLSCEGRTFFSGFAVSIKRPVHMEDYMYFPNSLLLVKEGETAELCAYIINDVLVGKADVLPVPEAEDFYTKIKEIYEG